MKTLYTKPRLRILAIVALSGLAVILALDVGRLVLAPTIAASIDAVRIRNAMVAQLGHPEDTEWRPETPPSDFHAETLPAPGYFTEIVQRLLPPAPEQRSSLEKAIVLTRHLGEHTSGSGAIQANTIETYEKIVSGKGGYCSDYTQVFNALALAAGIGVREWGFTWKDMANGHAFSEVWDDEHEKWVFIDSYFSFYVIDETSGLPMSVLEFRTALLHGRDTNDIKVVEIVPKRFGFPSTEQALKWYRRGLPRMFLLLANDVFSYDANPTIQAAESLPRSVELLLAVLIGEHPQFLFVPADSTPEIEAQVQALHWELIWVLAKISALVLTGLTLLVLLWRSLRRR